MRALLALAYEVLCIARLEVFVTWRLNVDEWRVAADVRVALVAGAVLGLGGGVGGVGVVAHGWVHQR
jgi:Ethanolamine utilization protein EutJ (predicted chaperonin)